MAVSIITDSTSDLTAEELQALNVHMIHMRVIFEDGVYTDGVDTVSYTHLDVYKRQKEYGHPKRRELAYLVVHSVLHLLGYDHLDEGPQKAQMRAREEAILAELGISR